MSICLVAACFTNSFITFCPCFFCRVIRIRRTREGNQEAVVLAICSKTFTSKVIIFRFIIVDAKTLLLSNSWSCAIGMNII